LVGAADEGQPVSLVFVNPVGFAAVNDAIGTLKADKIVSELGQRLRSAVRASDIVGRFGGVIFALALPNTSADEAQIVLGKLKQRLEDEPFGTERHELPFAYGVSTWEPGLESDEQELLRQSTHALALARRRGGGTAVWSADSEASPTDGSDQLTDVFTGNVAKDYRNMALLWRGLAIVSQASTDPRSMAAQVSSQLLDSSRADLVRIFLGQGESLQELTATQADPNALFQSAGRETIDLARRAMRENKTCTVFDVGADGQARVCSATPLVTEDAIGVLYLQANRERYRFDGEDMAFLGAFAKQLALALDRARMHQTERQQSGEERRQLKQEIAKLKRSTETPLVSRSPQLSSVLDRLARVAPTEATVLIEGPSGTGKELLARKVHELSARADGPYVVVDCGAMATTVIESELFGHSKGAYTGAEAKRAGRLLEAHGGTVFLDEIGELPLEVQSKLLRFVQERHFTPVGANSAKTVDVRIVAATNRDLAAEARAGRFREDLYYRLSVFSVAVPALVERPDDILPLAEHFLSRSAEQLGRRPAALSDEARVALMSYGWPGNVRELQNRILQAMIMSTNGTIHEQDLALPRRAAAAVVTPTEHSPAPTFPRAVERVESSPTETSAPRDLEPVLASLGRSLGEVLDEQSETNLPYGTWLASDLMLAANEKAHGGIRQGARILGIPMTTYRRRLAKAQAASSERPALWLTDVRPLLVELVNAADRGELDLVRATQDVLLLQIESRCESTLTGALWLGVSPPTYRRRVAELSA
ncbi:MAG: sigma 54-interacting transcriptional regulator, partial [Acidobacteriota bacterium]